MSSEIFHLLFASNLDEQFTSEPKGTTVHFRFH